jgi:hypothetical protein
MRGKPLKTAVERDRPSSHASKAVTARIEAGAVWVDIIDSDELAEPPVHPADATLWQRLLAWRRTMSNARLLTFGLVIVAGVTAFTLVSSQYRWPRTVPTPVDPPSCCADPGPQPGVQAPASTTALHRTDVPPLKLEVRPVSPIGGKPSSTPTSSSVASTTPTPAAPVTAAVTDPTTTAATDTSTSTTSSAAPTTSPATTGP